MPVPYVEPRADPVADAEPRSKPLVDPRRSHPTVPTYQEFSGYQRASGELAGYTLVPGDTWSSPWSSSNNSMSPSPTQSQTPGVRRENSTASEFPPSVSENETVVQPPRNPEQSISSQYRSFNAVSGRKPTIKSSSILLGQNTRSREIQARTSHSIIDDEDWQQIETGDRTSSASDGVFRCTTSPWRMREPRVTASLSFDSDPSNCGFSDTANPPLAYRDRDSCIGPPETYRAIGNQSPVDDGEFFATASPMSREMDTASSGEESFVFNSQSPPSFDGGSQQEFENLVSEIAQELLARIAHELKQWNSTFHWIFCIDYRDDKCGRIVSKEQTPRTRRQRKAKKTTEATYRESHPG
ncbi:hypothetical protein AYO22_04133 [Fonsecaea multimorphosa]|nr:hypothetical protein AYO22_04133 [Fonsecaea multimorphosa]